MKTSLNTPHIVHTMSRDHTAGSNKLPIKDMKTHEGKRTMKRNIYLNTLVVITLLLSILSWKPASASAILFVKPGWTGDCSDWDHACDLQYALQAVTTVTQIWVASGTYFPGETRFATFPLLTGVEIYGGFSGVETILADRNWVTNITILSGDIGIPGDSSDNVYHVVTGSAANETAVLDGFTITGGYADDRSTFEGFGGGMFTRDGSPSLANLIFSGNQALYGGGGGMYNAYASPSLENVTFSSNQATWASGGGMYNYYASPTLAKVTFTNNAAYQRGGAMYNHLFSNPSLTNITISGNSAYFYGGGIYNYGSSPVLKNVTLYGNLANQGGGIFNEAILNNGLPPTLSNPTLVNTIVWSNTPDSINDGINGSFANVTYSDIQGNYPGIGNTPLNPYLSPLADNGGATLTHAIDIKSIAIDHGDDDPLNCPATDQRGVSRPVDGNGDRYARCDMGAYEFVVDKPVQSTTTLLTASPTNLTINQPVTFTAAVSAANPPTPEGTITFMDGADTLGVVSLAGGEASFTTSNLSVGVHAIIASYSGGDGWDGSTSNTVNVTVEARSVTFVGFSAPVDNPSVLNVLNAGRSVPLKWRLLDNNGAPITDLTNVTVTVESLACEAGESTDLLEEEATGKSGLQNLGDGYYRWNWDTVKAYAGSCKTLKLDLGEGNVHTALFQFK